FLQEYNVRSSSTSDRTYFIGKFVTGVPNFSKKKNAVNKWSLQKEGLQGCQVTNALRDEEDEDEAIEEEGGLRKSVKDLQKLFGRATGLLDDSDGKDYDYMDVEMGLSPVVARKQEDAPKEELADISPSEAGPSGSVRGIPSSSKSSKIKRKSGGDDAEVVTGPPAVKVRFDNESKPSVKDERFSTPKSSASPKISASSAKAGPTLATGPVTEDEVRDVLLEMGPVTMRDLVAKFIARLKSQEEKLVFLDILKRISKMIRGPNYIVLREKKRASQCTRLPLLPGFWRGKCVQFYPHFAERLFPCFKPATINSTT
ncbi:transcription initiation factor IIF subunit alpha-like, partial [Macadamia integrifolia]|uniref:transcription initiation factor IIF subunit alpha-like n=1 Tax=Macadamia integrifolia TaxID=60698 RepID=UPI001C4E3FB9